MGVSGKTRQVVWLLEGAIEESGMNRWFAYKPNTSGIR